MEKLEKAEKSLLESIRYYNRMLSDLAGGAHSNILLSEVYEKQGDINNALVHARKALFTYERLKTENWKQQAILLVERLEKILD